MYVHFKCLEQLLSVTGYFYEGVGALVFQFPYRFFVCHPFERNYMRTYFTTVLLITLAEFLNSLRSIYAIHHRLISYVNSASHKLDNHNLQDASASLQVRQGNKITK